MSVHKQLEGKIAIVTGASNEIGRGIAEAFGANGAKTVLVARRVALLHEVAAGITSRGGEALPVPADLTHEEAVTSLFATVQKTYGRLDVLVNNAGIATHKDTEDITLRYWREALDINITAPFLCSREAIRMMKAQNPQGGRIINIGSASAKTPRPDLLPYTTTKFGLQGMTHQLTMDGRKYNIVASIIHPGATLSSFTTRRGRTKAGPGERPEDYVMAAEDVAKVAVLMAALPPKPQGSRTVSRVDWGWTSMIVRWPERTHSQANHKVRAERLIRHGPLQRTNQNQSAQRLSSTAPCGVVDCATRIQGTRPCSKPRAPHPLPAAGKISSSPRRFLEPLDVEFQNYVLKFFCLRTLCVRRRAAAPPLTAR